MRQVYSILILALFFIGCNNNTASTGSSGTIYYFDPQIPGGSITNSVPTSLTLPVTNVTADVSVLNQVTLNWTVPPLYTTMNYTINIYRADGDGTTFTLPDPTSVYSNASATFYLLTSLTGSSYVNVGTITNTDGTVFNMAPGQQYTYYLYISVNQSNGATLWSPGVQITATTLSDTPTFKMPTPASFWANLNQTIGTKVTNNIVTVNTYQPGVTQVGAPTGSIIPAYDGNVLYMSDTAYNRVLIYSRSNAYSCAQYQATDPASYYACIFEYANVTLTPLNILGQSSGSGSDNCQVQNTTCSARISEATCTTTGTNFNSLCDWLPDNTKTNPNGGVCSANAKCLTAPGRLYVSPSNELFISDTGNNRIVKYSTLPVQGHVRDINGTGLNLTPVDGGPSQVIGKQSLYDTTPSYPIGSASLNAPEGVVVNGTNLYIADTGNNRIVKIQNYADTTKFKCADPSQWSNLPSDSPSGTCKFSGLLGQKDYFQKWTFKEGSGTQAPGSLGYDGINCTTTNGIQTCSSPYISTIGANSTLGNKIIDDRMNRFFRKPVDIRFDSTGRMLVSTNEQISVTSPLGTAQLQSRILIFSSDPMSNQASADSTKCTAGWYTIAQLCANGQSSGCNNFDSTNLCQATDVIGQTNDFTTLLTVGPTQTYAEASNYALSSVDGFIVQGSAILAIDSTSNIIKYWSNFMNSILTNGAPPDSLIANPNGALNTAGTSYLPTLQGISDIELSSTDFIYIADPPSSYVYEIKANSN